MKPSFVFWMPVWLLALPVLAATAPSPNIRKPVSLETVTEWLGAHPSASLADTLKALPDELKLQAVWVYESGSAQLASKPRPRGIVTDYAGGLTIAFSGRSDDPLHDTLEMIQFRKATASFEMHFIDFGKRPRVPSPKDPAACLKCHGNDPRPNWDAYPKWPGVYGKKHHAVADADWGDFVDFTRNAGKELPYSHFFLEKRVAEGKKNTNALSDRNAKLSDVLGAHNFQRLARLLRSTQYGDDLILTVAGMLIDCEIETLFPESWDPIAKKMKAAQTRLKIEADQEYDVQTLTVKAFYELLGEKTVDWSMTPDRRVPRFNVPSNDTWGILGALLPQVKSLGEFFQPYPLATYVTPFAEAKTGNATTCERLAPVSTTALKKLKL